MLHQDSPTSNVLAFSIISNNSKSICSAHSEWSWCNSHSLWTLCWDAIIMEKIHKTCAIFERMKKQNNPSSWILCSTIILMLDCEQFLEWLMVPNKTICWPVNKLFFDVRGGRRLCKETLCPLKATLPPLQLSRFSCATQSNLLFKRQVNTWRIAIEDPERTYRNSYFMWGALNPSVHI